MRVIQTSCAWCASPIGRAASPETARVSGQLTLLDGVLHPLQTRTVRLPSVRPAARPPHGCASTACWSHRMPRSRSIFPLGTMIQCFGNKSKHLIGCGHGLSATFACLESHICIRLAVNLHDGRVCVTKHGCQGSLQICPLPRLLPSTLVHESTHQVANDQVTYPS